MGCAVVLASGAFIAIFALAAVGIVLAIVFGLKAEKKRRQMLAAWAAANGCSFEPDRVTHLELRFSRFDDFTKGDARYAHNVIRGNRNGRELWAFDYHYQTYSHSKQGRKTHHHHFTAVILDTGLALKPLAIRSEGFFDKLTAAVGFDDIDFESAEFSRTFHVKSPDRRWAYDVLHQETMEYLLGAPRYEIRFEGPHVLVRRRGTFRLPEYDEALAVAEGVLDRIPKDIVADLRA